MFSLFFWKIISIFPVFFMTGTLLDHFPCFPCAVGTPHLSTTRKILNRPLYSYIHLRFLYFCIDSVILAPKHTFIPVRLTFSRPLCLTLYYLLLGPLSGVLMSHVDFKKCQCCMSLSPFPLSPVKFEKWSSPMSLSFRAPYCCR